MNRNLELALVGNAGISALIDAQGEIVWACLPRVDGDPVFCSLLKPRGPAGGHGYFGIEVADLQRSEQHYMVNTAIIVTRLHDSHGGTVEITDFAPRFRQFGRMFVPAMLVRRVRAVAGSPRITVRLKPACDHGRARPSVTFGSHHVRYAAADMAQRLTTDCSITAVVEEVPFMLSGECNFVLGPDETLQGGVAEVAQRFEMETAAWWREWVRGLSIPFEWQAAIIRAAITLKLSTVEDTGAVIAAVTTSVPEAPGSERNWDYRFCWLRDAYFTINALNRLNATATMERYLGYIVNIASQAGGAGGVQLQPCYRINGRADMEEHIVPGLPGYRNMGPVRIGNQAASQVQNDVYGAAILAATHAFFDQRLQHPGGQALFAQLERLGEAAVRVWALPDAGLWELRGKRMVHTFSAVMCWAACDRLARIAQHIGAEDRARHWRVHASAIHKGVCEAAWSEQRNSFVAAFGGDALDASLLLLGELGFLKADDPRFAATVEAVARELKRGDFVFRYSNADDFGVPEHAFLVCSFWYIDALSLLGRRDEARALFETLLACRNRLGLLAEHVHPVTRELWGNFPQTYSMVGLINSATRLSIPWDAAF